jgi:hypothetical protein
MPSFFRKPAVVELDESELAQKMCEEARLRCEIELETSMERYQKLYPRAKFLEFLEAEWPRDYDIYKRSQSGDPSMERSYENWASAFAKIQAKRVDLKGINLKHMRKYVHEVNGRGKTDQQTREEQLGQISSLIQTSQSDTKQPKGKVKVRSKNKQKSLNNKRGLIFSNKTSDHNQTSVVNSIP